ncbi:MAG: cytochrome c oxidase subunit [Actinomycetota bacterium]|jgi:cytochrome c oxidase subunit 4|nr:cytochrome c oxidase subunit [Actinomycetota bacterium]
MTTAEEAPREELELHEHPGPGRYVAVAVILAIVTLIEVAIYYITSLKDLLVPMLITLSFFKFVMVGLYFMHLKYDSRIFRRLFITGIILAFFVFTIVLSNFFLHDTGPA